MEILIIVLLIILILLVAYSLTHKTPAEKPDVTNFQLILSQINELSRTVDGKLGDSRKELYDSFQKQASDSTRLIHDIKNDSIKIMQEVAEKLTRLDETNKQVVGFTDQLQSLQDILKNPKQRGILGEYYLETLLKNVMPPGSYQMQFPFSDGTIVDAAVFIKDKIIPVDSKFSLENYNRMTEEREPARKKELAKIFENDLKNRIVETAKYIQPQNNTMEFAFMFIPHEAIYYDLLIGTVGAGEEAENLIQRAASKHKVIIVSPTSFLAYLQTVLQALNAMKIEESAKDIVKRVGELSKHLKAYEEFHNKLGSSLGTVVNHYSAAGKELKKIDKDVFRISGNSMEIETIAIDKPNMEE